jgi:hypothetical protein
MAKGKKDKHRIHTLQENRRSRQLSESSFIRILILTMRAELSCLVISLLNASLLNITTCSLSFNIGILEVHRYIQTTAVTIYYQCPPMLWTLPWTSPNPLYPNSLTWTYLPGLLRVTYLWRHLATSWITKARYYCAPQVKCPTLPPGQAYPLLPPPTPNILVSLTAQWTMLAVVGPSPYTDLQ